MKKKFSLEVSQRNINKGVFVKRVLEYHRWTGKQPLRKRASNLGRPKRGISSDSDSAPSTYALRPVSFILAIGDDRSDEFMFEAVEKQVESEGATDVEHFTCTVGRKSSSACYFLPTFADVLGLLHEVDSDLQI